MQNNAYSTTANFGACSAVQLRLYHHGPRSLTAGPLRVANTIPRGRLPVTCPYSANAERTTKHATCTTSRSFSGSLFWLRTRSPLPPPLWLRCTADLTAGSGLDASLRSVHRTFGHHSLVLLHKLPCDASRLPTTYLID